MIRATCPGCGRECAFADFLAGLTAVCKNCGHRIPVPASGPSAPRPEDAVRAAPGGAPPPRPPGDAIQAAPGTTQTTAMAASVLRLSEGPAPPSDGAGERASELLPAGVRAPHLERELVAQGLSPEAAAAVVDKVLEERVRQQLQPLRQTDRHRLVHRLLSAAVGAVCVLAAYRSFGTYPACRIGVGALLPLACIWFPDEMGGYVGKRWPYEPSLLGTFVRWCAWVVLAALATGVLGLGLTFPAG